MNPQDQKVPDQHSGPDAEAVAWLNSYNVPEGALKPKRSRKWLWVVVICLLLIVGGVSVFALLSNSNKSNSSQSDKTTLATVTQGAITFSYPKDWQKIDAAGFDYSVAYGESSDTTKTPPSVYYKKIALPDGKAAPSKLTTDYKQQVLYMLAQNTNDTYAIDSSGCQAFRIVDKKIGGNDMYASFTVSFSCDANKSGVAVQEVDTYLYTGDGNLYQVAIVAQKQQWQKNKAIFDSMLQKILPK